METFHLDIITPERQFISEDVEWAEIPGASGEFEVLPGHTPFLTPLRTGIVTYSREGIYRYAGITGGFCETGPSSTVILAHAAEFPHEIDRERAVSARDRARERLSSDDPSIDKKRALKALDRANTRLKLTEMK